ncbi:MAG: ADP-ribosylglycohydrolase family protein [Candidatus Margulisbacteria bacterium]|nr:ADP-ribosylglycohydrolase family protein [Candidatus Margulisiibacteriota bacterium]
MNQKSAATTRSLVTRYYLETGRRRQPHWASVSISLPHCRQFVTQDNRLDRGALADAAPKVFGYILAKIQSRFTVKQQTGEVVNHKQRLLIRLEDNSLIFATFSDTDIKLEAVSKSRKKLEVLRQVFNDLKLELTRGANTGQIVAQLMFSKKQGRATAGKIIGELADRRFLPIIREKLFSDPSAAVRREIVKARGQMGSSTRRKDLERALQDKDEVVRMIASAFLRGNRFDPIEHSFNLRPQQPGSAPGERLAGCLLGMAIGDMVGRPLEFLSRDEIRQHFGYPVNDLVVSKNPQIAFGQFSDDTELALMLTEAIRPKLGFQPDVFAGYLAEHVYQIDTGAVPNHGFGAATMRAGRYLYYGIPWTESGIDVSTCGPVLRVEPLAIYYQNDLAKLEEATVVSSLITHRSRQAVAGAVAVAFAVAKLLVLDHSSEPSTIVNWLIKEIRRFDPVVADKLHQSADLALSRRRPVEEAYDLLGNSSETRDIVPLAFYAFLRSPRDLRQTIITAVNAGGDTDSVGAVAGALSGAYNGTAAIPGDWLNDLRDSNLVYAAIRRLHLASAVKSR